MCNYKDAGNDIDKRIRPEYMFDECLCGFRRGRSIQEHIFTIKKVNAETLTRRGKYF